MSNMVEIGGMESEDEERRVLAAIRQEAKLCSCGSNLEPWWEYDAQGIALCKVCASCEKERLSHYRPEILSGYTQADVDEPIEPESY